ncbi:glutamate receptor ionotropic, delta-2-like [Palaemon carinicauda]|uniref:glutamate receptor ionotropic, delta-2-like n=1 Tax=Palaemon carinicauda TaxID=392227 RepID=UPI0035B671BC
MRSAGSYRWHDVNKADSLSLKRPLTPDLLEVYSDFRGRELKSAVVDNWPYFKITPLDENNALPHSGIDCNILNSMAVKLNFTYKLKPDPENRWGGPQPDGTVDGMIGMVARREVDFAINEITITDARETVVDFTTPYFLESSAITTRAPVQLSKAGAVFFPFSSLVWMLLMTAVALIGPLLSCVDWVMSKYLSAVPRGSLQMFSFNMYRNVVLQGNLINSTHWPHRFIFFFWYLFCLYIYAFYQGTLTAVLAVPLFDKHIDSLNDLLASMQKGEFAMLILQASQSEYLFRDATSGIYKEIWDLFNKDHYVTSTDEGVAEVLTGKFAFVEGMLSCKIRASKIGRNKFHVARQGFYPQGYGMALNSGAPYMRVFEKTLMQLMEGGLIAKWTRDEVISVKGSATSEGNSENRGPGAFTLEHLQAAFFILGLGTTLSSLVLLAERWVFYPRRKSSKGPYHTMNNTVQ